MEEARQSARASATEPQDLNRSWWESLPMTYQPWDDNERTNLKPRDFQRLERDFLDANPWLSERFDFRAYAGRRVLEIGCGAGAASCLFAKGASRVTAVDLTPTAVQLSSRNARIQRLNIDVRQMDAEELALPSDSVDHVF